MARLKDKYVSQIAPAMQQKFGYKNVNEIPSLVKIVINMGLGDVKDDAKKFEAAVNELATISGQKPYVTKAKKSVANFKVREGMNIGAKVTLRGDRMYEFADKLINIAIPRIRDFHGINGNVNTDVKAPYQVCTVHTKEAWEAYEKAHPSKPSNPTTPTVPTPSNPTIVTPAF